MDEKIIQEYRERFDREFSLLENDNYSDSFLELTEQGLNNKQEVFAESFKPLDDTKDLFYSEAVIFYGFRVGIVRLKGKSKCFTRQGGYQDSAIWQYDVNDILGKDNGDEDAKTGTINLINWAINPEGNTDISDFIIEKMIVPIVKTLNKVTAVGKTMDCTIVMPPMSADIEAPDWHYIFSNIKNQNISINIANYGQLFDLQKGERKYVFQHAEDGKSEYLIVSAYEMIRGHCASIGCMAFDLLDEDCFYLLHEFKEESFTIDNRQSNYKKKTILTVEKNDWNYISCRYPVSIGFTGFLGSHSTSFGREMYKVNREESKGDALVEKLDKESLLVNSHNDNYEFKKRIQTILGSDRALQVGEICGKLLEEKNLYNIALGDLVYVADFLQKSQGFRTVSIETNHRYQLGTYKGFAETLDISRITEVPANCFFITWKLRNSNKPLVPYFSLDARKHTIVQMIESIVNHFDHCSTAMVADELLYFYKNGEDSSAFFAAKVFLFLSQMDSLEIESRNEYIDIIENVDQVVYHEIDKSNIPIQNQREKRSQRRATSFFKETKSQDRYSLMRIDQLGLSIRTANALKRAGIRTVGDVIKRSPKEITRINNVGIRGMNEIQLKVHGLGLRLRDEKNSISHSNRKSRKPGQ